MGSYLTKHMPSTELMESVVDIYTTINQQDAAVHSQFYYTAALLYMFRVLSTPIIRSTSTVSTAPGTGHTSVIPPTWPSSNSAMLEVGSCTDV